MFTMMLSMLLLPVATGTGNPVAGSSNDPGMLLGSIWPFHALELPFHLGQVEFSFWLICEPCSTRSVAGVEL